MRCEMMPMLAGRVSWKVDDRTIIIVLEEEVEEEVVGREEEESGKVVTMQELGEVAVAREGMVGTDGGIDRISLLLILCYLYFDVFCWEGGARRKKTHVDYHRLIFLVLLFRKGWKGYMHELYITYMFTFYGQICRAGQGL